jgi:hypothetical protein
MTLAMLSQLAACTEPTQDEGEDYGEAQQAVLTKNALTKNALTKNALTKNALTKNALTKNALTKNALTMSALTDPDARELLRYVTSCALPGDAHFDLEIAGQTYGFDGGLGLAPEWGEPGGSCDDECVSWVSACVISRLDYLGQPVDISLRGKNPALSSTAAEREDFPLREATYYGDIFASPQKIFACLPPGETAIPRVCGPSLAGCIVEVQGGCEELCGDERNDGSYPKCREKGQPKKNGGVKKGEKHLGSVTVFLSEEP